MSVSFQEKFRVPTIKNTTLYSIAVISKSVAKEERNKRKGKEKVKRREEEEVEWGMQAGMRIEWEVSLCS